MAHLDTTSAEHAYPDVARLVLHACSHWNSGRGTASKKSQGQQLPRTYKTAMRQAGRSGSIARDGNPTVRYGFDTNLVTAPPRHSPGQCTPRDLRYVVVRAPEGPAARAAELWLLRALWAAFRRQRHTLRMEGRPLYVRPAVTRITVAAAAQQSGMLAPAQGSLSGTVSAKCWGSGELTHA